MFRTCVIKWKDNVNDTQMGYLARFVEGLSNDLVDNNGLLKFIQGGALGDPSALMHWLKLSQKHTLLPAISSNKCSMCPKPLETQWSFWSRDPYL